MLAGRYRILGLLGRGGMGEVYRADDLKLGQAVALKFLPSSVEKDGDRLQRFLNEVKIARQISHPNVCRVYDVGEVDGLHYLSMEYVDGEDLASLLRRIGRLPLDKAVQIARELCQGLAAAHEQGILHRDLKPANVMIDGRGRAKIADFGLASLAGDIHAGEIGAGTPAYMAPEQRAGKDVTVRSDIFSLGLVLYELTTGKPAFTMADQSTPASPASLVPGMDPAAERVILRCLQHDPVLRPASALAVAAALPGGDPLAAALAAGETPSPQMVANAPATGGLSARAAWTCLVLSVAMTLAVFFANQRLQLLPHLPLAKNPEALADRARETIEHLGYASLPFETRGFSQNSAYLFHIQNTDAAFSRWDALRTGQPAALRFWLRTSPSGLAPANPANTQIAYADPPFTAPGMVGIQLDTKGRLLQLDAVPPLREAATPETAAHPRTNWPALFDAAGMKLEDFKPVPPEWTPSTFADERLAWDGTYPDAKNVPIRIEAAAFGGRPVSFRIIEPWTPTADDSEPSGVIPWLSTIVEVLVPILVLIGGTFLAVRNIRLGRSDRRGAFRIGLYLFVVRMLVYVFMQNGSAGTVTYDGFLSNFSFSLYRFVLVWICYVAIEPYLRRLWPHTLISWARLLEGRFKDPLVGRDCLFGILAASGVWLVLSGWPLVSLWRGIPQPAGQLSLDPMVLKTLVSLPFALSSMLFTHASFLLNSGFSMIVVLVLLRLLTRRSWIAAALWVPIIVMLIGAPDQDVVLFVLLASATLAVFFRLGVLPLMILIGLSGFQVPVPGTLELSAWYAGPTWVFLAVFFAVAIYGFTVSLGGRRAFGKILAEE
jgi:serine/threonine-protein kinase